jgi:hypothetical protein
MRPYTFSRAIFSGKQLIDRLVDVFDGFAVPALQVTGDTSRII